MKKSAKITLALIILCLTLAVSFFVIGYTVLIDEISDSDKTTIDKTVLFTHNTKKGEKVETSISCTSQPIGDNAYLVDIIFNDGKQNKKYNIKNTRVSLNITEDTDILSAFYSAGGSNYTIPNNAYSRGSDKTVECVSDDGYIHLKLLLSDSDAKSLNLTVEYDITGSNLYSFNKFEDNTWEDIEVNLV